MIARLEVTLSNLKRNEVFMCVHLHDINELRTKGLLLHTYVTFI